MTGPNRGDKLRSEAAPEVSRTRHDAACGAKFTWRCPGGELLANCTAQLYRRISLCRIRGN